MSSVRMCDKCGLIFSENDENWSTMTGSRMFTNPRTGKRESQTVEMDVCGTCNSGTPNRLVPQVALEGQVLPNQG